jgi:uncharacterized membrane protein
MVRNTVRTALVGAILGIAFVVPRFGDMVQLVGGFVNCLVGFVMPPIIALKISAALRRRKSVGCFVALAAIVAFGAVALAVSAFFTIRDIVHGK